MNVIALKAITIRPVAPEDASLLFELMTSAKFLAKIGDRGIKSEADARQYILAKMHPDLKKKGFFVNHIIMDSETKAEIGTCSLHDREGINGVDIGYAILERYEGMGYATAAAQKMVDLAFGTYGLSKVCAITNVDNLGSSKVLEKVGFSHVGNIEVPITDHPVKLYELSYDEFKNKR
ncbi:GNAT family N-acetyltransferase [Marivirga arenosa]|uniref:GNAT family N-acetyltransferase n=1 Tax=Marivirga arenosa TaxID=3059076 RepID=A0AA49GKD9_9BACT|nr:GNAT family N-acetyltransferase [Marivirga sp. ABR2-2]WKK84304.1 GNAT family N-acetyltransferase [Marivirga sp. ABR2-2]